MCAATKLTSSEVESLLRDELARKTGVHGQTSVPHLAYFQAAAQDKREMTGLLRSGRPFKKKAARPIYQSWVHGEEGLLPLRSPLGEGESVDIGVEAADLSEGLIYSSRPRLHRPPCRRALGADPARRWGEEKAEECPWGWEDDSCGCWGRGGGGQTSLHEDGGFQRRARDARRRDHGRVAAMLRRRFSSVHAQLRERGPSGAGEDAQDTQGRAIHPAEQGLH